MSRECLCSRVLVQKFTKSRRRDGRGEVSFDNCVSRVKLLDGIFRAEERTRERERKGEMGKKGQKKENISTE